MEKLAASIFDHPAILLLVLFVTLVRWLISKANAAKQDTQTPMATPPPEPITRGGESQSEEERVRKFLEALGQPKGTPPPKIAPRPKAARPRIFPNLPPLTTAPPPLPEASSTRPPPPLPTKRTPFQRATPLDATFEIQEFAKPAAPQTPVETPRPAAGPAELRTRFGSAQDLRTAIVLREIFGPPRSLQPADLTSLPLL